MAACDKERWRKGLTRDKEEQGALSTLYLKWFEKFAKWKRVSKGWCDALKWFPESPRNRRPQQCDLPHRLRKSKEDEIIDQHQDMLLFRFIQRKWDPASDKCEWTEEGCWVEKRCGQVEPADPKRQLSSTEKKLHEAVKRANALLFGKM